MPMIALTDVETRTLHEAVMNELLNWEDADCGENQEEQNLWYARLQVIEGVLSDAMRDAP